MNPVVSVCIPVYKKTPYLRQTVKSLISQTFKEWELIICLNASDETAFAILDDLKEELLDSRVNVIREKKPLSMAENWNASVNGSTGEFVKLLCHDDLPHDNALERQVKALREHPDVVVASGARTIINSKGKVLFKRSGIRKSGVYPGREMIRRCIMAGTNIIGDPVNVMWRRSAMEKVGFFDTTVVYCTDVEYWLRLLSEGDLYYDAAPNGFYRIHGNAAATSLANVTVQDFLHTAELQANRGSITLSKTDMHIISIKSRMLSMLRQNLYRILG